jgi:hypothetical protein
LLTETIVLPYVADCHTDFENDLVTLVHHKHVVISTCHKYIHDVLSINNPNFANWIPLLYPKELVVKNTKKMVSSASLLDMYYHFNLSLENEIRISKLKVICSPCVSITIQPNLRHRLLFTLSKVKIRDL